MDSRKERILIAAEEMFAYFGIQKTTMEDIAKKAGMGKSSLYYYFKSKEDVFAEVIGKDSIRFKDQANRAIADGHSPQEKIANYILIRMIHLKELKNYYSTLTKEYPMHFAFVETARKDFNEFEINTLSLLIEEGVEQGIFAMNSVETAVRIFAICLKGLEYTFLTNDLPGDIEKDSRLMLQILFKGIEVHGKK
jgi:AcrR family transcriptional regulator